MKQQLIAFGALSLLGVALVSNSGCGGGTASAVTSMGRATVTIAWPETGRLIPTAANSIMVVFYKDGTVVGSQTAARPSSGTSSTLSFPELPAGSLSVVATAYPNTDGTGTAQATATVATTIVSGQTVPVALTMASTISSLRLSASSSILAIGGVTALTATGLDASGSAVLTSASTLTWSSSDTSIATVSATGSVTAVGAGTAQLQVSDSESGKSAMTTITVSPAVSVALTPITVTLSVRATQSFAATVANTTDQSIIWSVQESSGGSITAAGLYTAPSAAGVYHVVATSVADPTKTATAAITVQSGGATVTVN